MSYIDGRTGKKYEDCEALAAALRSELEVALEEARRYKTALEEIAIKGDQVVTAPDGLPTILTVSREAEECAAVARSALVSGGRDGE